MRKRPKELDTGVYFLDGLRISRALYRLLSYFLASPGIARMITEEGHDYYVIQRMVDEHEEEEILDSLIYSAAFLRIADDLKQLHYDITKKDYMSAGVGQITINRTKKPLSLREACNKIIHAKRIKYDFGEEEYLNPVIHLSGTTPGSKKRWRAEINIKKYVESANRALP